MKREIKFRCYHDTSMKMESWDEMKNYPIKTLESNSNDFYMQFTGLKDKNGKEIYEGDIILYPGPYEYKAIVDFKSENYDGGVYFCGYSIWPNKNREIIGNIYENPELFKNEK